MLHLRTRKLLGLLGLDGMVLAFLASIVKFCCRNGLGNGFGDVLGFVVTP